MGGPRQPDKAQSTIPLGSARDREVGFVRLSWCAHTVNIALACRGDHSPASSWPHFLEMKVCTHLAAQVSTSSCFTRHLKPTFQTVSSNTMRFIVYPRPQASKSKRFAWHPQPKLQQTQCFTWFPKRWTMATSHSCTPLSPRISWD